MQSHKSTLYTLRSLIFILRCPASHFALRNQATRRACSNLLRQFCGVVSVVARNSHVCKRYTSVAYFSLPSQILKLLEYMPKYAHRIFLALASILLTFLVFAVTGCSSTQSTPDDFSRVAALKPNSISGINAIRATALKQTARSVGAQAGLAWRARQINRILVQQKYKLNQVFDFNYLLLDHNVLPPVLTEANNILNLADDQTIRLADKEYQIVYPPRFVTAPPTWRDYIWMNYKKPEAPNATLLPKNSRESKVWNEYIKVGWNDGVIQANEIFLANLSRLTRDFNGMILYRKLYAKNMVTAPFVSEADLGITGDSNDLKINDKILRITSTSELKGNSKKWNPVITEKHEDDYGEGDDESDSILTNSMPPKGGRG